MSEHFVDVRWKRQTNDFAYDSFNRGHDWTFDSGLTVPGSSAPGYYGDMDRVDPEEALIAALSSCHMLTFLAIASKKKLVVDAYDDRPVGHLDKNEQGKIAITGVDLNPRVAFAPGVAVDAAALKKLHDSAHDHCFIANSITARVTINPK